MRKMSCEMRVPMKLSSHLPEAIIHPSFPQKTGIYFLTLGGEVVYIGQAKDIFIRLIKHRGTIEFDGFAFLEFPQSKLNEQEVIFILKFLPRHNRSIPKGGGVWSALEIKARLMSVIPNCRSGNETIKKIMTDAGGKQLPTARGLYYRTDAVIAAFTEQVMEDLRLKSGAQAKRGVRFPK